MPSPSKSWDDLVSNGWKTDPGDPKAFIQPSGKRVTRKRDLSIQERIEYGDILFPPPGKLKKW